MNWAKYATVAICIAIIAHAAVLGYYRIIEVDAETVVYVYVGLFSAYALCTGASALVQVSACSLCTLGFDVILFIGYSVALHFGGGHNQWLNFGGGCIGAQLLLRQAFCAPM